MRLFLVFGRVSSGMSHVNNRLHGFVVKRNLNMTFTPEMDGKWLFGYSIDVARVTRGGGVAGYHIGCRSYLDFLWT